MSFKESIEKAGYTLDNYLAIAKRKASKYGYQPKMLKLSESPYYKLNYDGVNFGSAQNKDFIIYSMEAKSKLITKEEAKKHQEAYLARATKIKGEWKNNNKSKNNLAIRILW